MPSAVTQAMPANSSTTTQNGATGTGAGVSVALTPGMDLADIVVSGGIATITIEASYDGGTNWFACAVQTLASGSLGATIAVVVGAAHYLCTIPPGATHLRTRISAFVSGAITCVCTTRRR